MLNRIEIPHLESKTERLKWLQENKTLLLDQKKAIVKEADTVPFFVDNDSSLIKTIDKAATLEDKSEDDDERSINGVINAKLVINTTNVIDTHMDCHMKGLWKKALNEKKQFYLTQEHNLNFRGIITDKVKAYTKSIAWSKLGAPYEGSTEALMFDAEIESERNEYMYQQYAKGYVKNHSVGMRYVKIFMCVDDETKYWAEEKANWDKYYSEVVNKEVADERGYFFAVTEAKIIEGSAVVMGSNMWTPTMKEENIEEPIDDGLITPTTEPLESTQTDTPIVTTTKSTFLNSNLY